MLAPVWLVLWALQQYQIQTAYLLLALARSGALRSLSGLEDANHRVLDRVVTLGRLQESDASSSICTVRMLSDAARLPLKGTLLADVSAA